METVLENASVGGYWQKEVTISAGASVNITSYLRKVASMSYLPRVIVFNKASSDPFAGGAGLHTFTMTDSIDTWESDLYTYTNSGTADVTLMIRTQGMAASGSMYSVIDVEQINVDMTTALAKLNEILEDTGTDIPAQISAIPVVTPPSAIEIREEIDINSTQLEAIKAKTDNLPAYPANEATLTATAHDVWAYATRTLTGFTTTEFNMIGPVRSDGRIDAIAGDDYYAADGRGMRWSDTAWPNLTGATVNFISGSTTIAMTVVTAGSGEQTVNLDVPKATSAAMKGQFKFIIRATLTNAHVVTLLEGEGRFK